MDALEMSILLDTYGSSINAAAVVEFEKVHGEADVPRATHSEYQKIRERILNVAVDSWQSGDDDIALQEKIRNAS